MHILNKLVCRKNYLYCNHRTLYGYCITIHYIQLSHLSRKGCVPSPKPHPFSAMATEFPTSL